jgi:hypothetical protein
VWKDTGTAVFTKKGKVTTNFADLLNENYGLKLKRTGNKKELTATLVLAVATQRSALAKEGNT